MVVLRACWTSSSLRGLKSLGNFEGLNFYSCNFLYFQLRLGIQWCLCKNYKWVVPSSLQAFGYTSYSTAYETAEDGNTRYEYKENVLDWYNTWDLLNTKLTGTSKCSVNPRPACPRTPNDALSSMMRRTLYLYFNSILRKQRKIALSLSNLILKRKAGFYYLGSKFKQ